MDQETETTTETPMTQPQTEKTSAGSVIGILIIVLVLAFGAFYFLKQVPAPTNGLTPAEEQADPTISKLAEQGTSTDLTSIENDLNATDFSGLDEGLGDISI